MKHPEGEDFLYALLMTSLLFLVDKFGGGQEDSVIVNLENTDGCGPRQNLWFCERKSSVVEKDPKWSSDCKDLVLVWTQKCSQDSDLSDLRV